MNARQKAKKYKRIAEERKKKADAWDRLQLEESLRKQEAIFDLQTIKTVHFLDREMMKWYGNDKTYLDFQKREAARDIANHLLDLGLITWYVQREPTGFVQTMKSEITVARKKG